MPISLYLLIPVTTPIFVRMLNVCFMNISRSQAARVGDSVGKVSRP